MPINPFGDSIINLYLQRGNAQAQAAQQIGAGVSGALGAVAKEREEAPIRKQEATIRDLQAKNLTSEIGARDADQKAQDAQRATALNVQKVHGWLSTLASIPDPDARDAAYQEGRAKFLADGTMPAENLPQTFPGMGWVKARYVEGLPLVEQYKALFPDEKKPEPFTLGEGAKRYGPDGKLIADNPKPPEGAHSQESQFLLNGKTVKGDYIPGVNGTPGRYFYNGEDVTGRASAIPAASIQINAAAQSALANLPSWATDDSRPSGADANTLNPTVRMTPNGLYQAALSYIATGQFPQTGRGNDPSSQAVRAAITSKVGAIAASSGMDEPALRAFYKANSQSLTQQQKLYDAAQSNITTADRNVAELEKHLAKIPDTGSPLFNRPLRAFSKTVSGNPELAPIATYLASVQNEYGKIISSANGGSAVLTDSARHEAQTLLDPNATVQQMIGSIQALKTEGGNRLLSIGEQIQRIQQRMTPGGGSAPPPTAPKGEPIKVGGFTVTAR